MPDPVVFVDTETTALDRDLRQIWEVALVTAEGTEHVWHLPVDLSKADPISLSMNGFHDRYNNWDTPPEDWPYYRREFASEFEQLTRGLHLVGACVNFDELSLWRLLRDHGQTPMWHYHLGDVENMAVGYLASGVTPRAWPGTGFDYPRDLHRPPWDSRLLSLAVGVDPERFDRHTALGDALWAKAIYEAVMG